MSQPNDTQSEALPTFIDALEFNSRKKWADRFGVTEAALLRAVRMVGRRTKTVLSHLGKSHLAKSH